MVQTAEPEPCALPGHCPPVSLSSGDCAQHATHSKQGKDVLLSRRSSPSTLRLSSSVSHAGCRPVLHSGPCTLSAAITVKGSALPRPTSCRTMDRSYSQIFTKAICQYASLICFPYDFSYQNLFQENNHRRWHSFIQKGFNCIFTYNANKIKSWHIYRVE